MARGGSGGLTCMANGREGGFFESPHAAVYALIAVNVVVFALCARQSGGEAISGELLFRNGAMYSAAIDRHEYWRLVAYGFLHANLIHVASNMLCLALWGGHLERRVGSCYFLVIYLCAVIGGAVVGRYTHADPYLTVGASGGISGVLGALLCLWILGKIDVSANFFVVNIGLNVALGFSASRIDWGAHFGGFAVGLIACAVIDLVEKATAFLLRCKFPEFVKVNALMIFGVIALVLSASRPTMPGGDGWQLPVAVALAGMLAVKACDLLLSIKHGMSAVVVVLVIANAALAWLAGAALAVRWACAFHTLPLVGTVGGIALDTACGNLDVTLIVAASTAAVLTLLLYWHELRRGIADVGFVGATLRAERTRRSGL
jgi:membrane associated rhomboid family serine protease